MRYSMGVFDICTQLFFCNLLYFNYNVPLFRGVVWQMKQMLQNDFIANEVLRALGKMRQTEGKVGPKVCQDCGENIPDARRKLGFSLCIECAEESERRKALFADY